MPKGIMFGFQSPFELRSKPNSPTMPITIPPISNHMVLSVGEPVKNRDTPELNDSEALTPQMINKIPTINSTTEIPLPR